MGETNFYLLILQKYISSKQSSDSERKKNPLCSGTISKDFTAINIENKD